MPNEDGYKLAEQVRSREAASLKRTVLIALTGFVGQDDQREAIDRGFDAHLSKPIDLDELAARIRKLGQPES